MNFIKTQWLFPITASLFFIFALGCKKKVEDPIVVNNVAPTALDCDHFSQNRILKKVENAAVDYVVSCVMDIVDADIVIEPGVVIEFKENAGIWLRGDGSLKMAGTSDSKITLTGVNKNIGSWRGILINSPSTVNEISHCEIKYAGGNSFNSNDDRGAIILWASAKLKLNNTLIEYSLAHGLNAIYGESQIVFSSNVFKNNTLAPVRIIPAYINFLDVATDYTGNLQNYVHVEVYTSGISSDAAIRNLNVPYRVQLRGGVEKYIVISSNVTVAAGVTMEFANAAGILVDGGSFNAVGTSTLPITFTGTTKSAGSWTGFTFRHTSSPLNEIAYATIEYAGGDVQQGAIYMFNSPRLSVNNTTIKDILNCAFYASANNPNPNLTTSALTFTNVAGGNFCGE
jgi:hypothetical protein